MAIVNNLQRGVLALNSTKKLIKTAGFMIVATFAAIREGYYIRTIRK